MTVKEINEEVITRAMILGRQIGHTPVVRLKTLEPAEGVQVWAKQEWKQLSGSVKARAAYFIIMDALEKGELGSGKALLDATSGNTGIAYATIGAALGIKVVLCLPENASAERKQILYSLGAEIVYTSKYEGTDGAQQVAREMAEKYPGKFFYADQYKNENNWKAHYCTTANEIMADLPGLTHFVAGLGTTGTFVGTSRKLRELRPQIKLVSLQPDTALHGMEGWKHLETAAVPAIYDASLADDTMQVSTEETYETLKLVHRKEGLLVSPSSAANIAGAMQLAGRIRNGIIVTVLPDNADKYGEVIKKIIV